VTLAALNRRLDALPRTRFGEASRAVPAFRTCGVAGFYLAVAAALGGALLAGRELLPVAALCVVCALSFFAYVYVRRWITGREQLVLLQQVWTAEAFCAAALAALRLPVLPYLDVIAPAMAFFLAAGRVGCLLAGCCHGRPSSLGVAYGEEHAARGFPRHLVGVRLFPVQALEAAGLLVIGATGLAALPFAAPGRVFAWFLAAYAVLRFGTEGLRGDRRPHWLGLSVPRWMALAELGAACWITRSPTAPERDAAIVVLLLATLAASLVAVRVFRRPAFTSPAHAAEVRAAARELADHARGGGDVRVAGTSRGAGVAVTAPDAAQAVVSLGMGDGGVDVEALCALMAAAFPEHAAGSARLTTGGRLLAAVPLPLAEAPPSPVRGAAERLMGNAVRRLQAETAEADADDPAPPPSAPEDPGRDGYFGPRAATPPRPVRAVR
jgi:hypothetical protein